MLKKICSFFLLLTFVLPLHATMIGDFDSVEDNFGVTVNESTPTPKPTPTPTPTPTPVPSSSSSGGGGGGGGGGAITPDKDNCPKGDFSASYYDKTCGDVPKDPPTVTDAPSTTLSGGTSSIDPENIKFPTETSKKTFVPETPKPQKEKTCDVTYSEVITQRKCSFQLKNISFLDIEKSFAKEYISKLGNAGIVNGYYGTNMYKPNNTISRSEYLKVVLKSLCMDYEEMDVSQLPFRDVDTNTWQAKAISKAYQLDIIDKNNKNFRPNDPITRSEALKILFALSGIIPQGITTTEFDDVKSNTWEVKYIQTAKNMCLVEGYEEKGQLIFRPYQNMTRAEVAKVVSNMIGL